MGAVTQWHKMRALRAPTGRKIETFHHREAIKKAGGRWRKTEEIWYVPADRFDEILALCLLPADPEEAAALRERWYREDRLAASLKLAALFRAQASAAAVHSAIEALAPDTAHFVVRVPQAEADTPMPKLFLQAPGFDEVEAPPAASWSELLSNGRSERCFEWSFHPERLPKGFTSRLENAASAKQRRHKGKEKPGPQVMPLFDEGAKS